MCLDEYNMRLLPPFLGTNMVIELTLVSVHPEISSHITEKSQWSVIIGLHLASKIESKCAIWGSENYQAITIILHQLFRWLLHRNKTEIAILISLCPDACIFIMESWFGYRGKLVGLLICCHALRYAMEIDSARMRVGKLPWFRFHSILPSHYQQLLSVE